MHRKKKTLHIDLLITILWVSVFCSNSPSWGIKHPKTFQLTKVELSTAAREMEMKNMTRSHLVLECCLLDWASAQSKASLQPLMSCSQVHLCWHLHKSWLAQSNKSNNRTPLGFRLAQQFLPVTHPQLSLLHWPRQRFGFYIYWIFGICFIYLCI